MTSPNINPLRKVTPMFTVANTQRGDKHFGLIVRHVSDYAQVGNAKFHAAVAIIALFKFIIQIGVVIRRGGTAKRVLGLSRSDLERVENRPLK